MIERHTESDHTHTFMVFSKPDVGRKIEEIEEFQFHTQDEEGDKNLILKYGFVLIGRKGQSFFFVRALSKWSLF